MQPQSPQGFSILPAPRWEGFSPVHAHVLALVPENVECSNHEGTGKDTDTGKGLEGQTPTSTIQTS